MIRLPVAVLGGLTLCLATSAFAQTATTAAPGATQIQWGVSYLLNDAR